jgi:hypothetical protein
MYVPQSNSGESRSCSLTTHDDGPQSRALNRYLLR